MSSSESSAVSIPKRDDNLNLPPGYSVSVGGTIFSTTPGGTKIVYSRESMMLLRNSPLSRTPPVHLPVIPGITSPADPNAAPVMAKVDEEDDSDSEAREESTFEMEL
eukprot:GILI01004195.1.p1 GENE.GILI01004195.1~~GILI01004195.1.p1  ORF type:complete len:107 (+),score=23.21 GILI01004195.1:105-425(+)